MPNVKSLVAAALIALISTASGYIVAEPTEPSIHDVYQAVLAGKYGEAQAMMDNVLRDHPDSSKAHYVEAQVLAIQNRFSDAQAELETAERLSPSITFAKPESIADLKSRIAAGLTETKNTVRQDAEGSGTKAQAMSECVTVQSLSELSSKLGSTGNGRPTLIYARADWAISAVSVDDSYVSSIAFRRILADVNCVIADTTADKNGEVAKHFNSVGVPFFILLNSDNKEVAKVMGGLDLPAFKSWYQSVKR